MDAYTVNAFLEIFALVDLHNRMKSLLALAWSGFRDDEKKPAEAGFR